MIKKYFTIKDVERQSGIDRTTLFRWERQRKFPRIKRHSMSNFRMYEQPDIDRILKLVKVK